MRAFAARRRGFTLVELVVAIGIAILLLGLAIGVSQTDAFDSYRTTGTADKVSQWLIIAKQRAMRDKLPRGVRLVVGTDPTQPNTVSECVYIEAPDPWFPSNPTQQLVIQQVIDEGDPQTAVPSPGLPPERRRLFSTRLFLCIQNGTLAEAATLQDQFQVTGAANNPRAVIRPGDTLLVPELNGQGFRVVGIHLPGNPAPAYAPGSAANPTGAPNAVVVSINPPPVPPPGPVAGTDPNMTQGFRPVVELELAAFPNLAPGYSKFRTWSTTGRPPILFSDPTGMVPPSSPPGPPEMFDPTTSAGLELPGVPPNGPAANFATQITSGFGFFRAARPLLGEPTLKLPKDTVIDLNPTPNTTGATGYLGGDIFTTYTPVGANTAASGFVDILFTPAGGLLGNPNASTQAIQVLLVRDVTKRPAPVAPATVPDLRDPDAYGQSGSMALVVVFSASGTIVTKPVANPASNATNDPFVFAKDGIAGGL